MAFIPLYFYANPLFFVLLKMEIVLNFYLGTYVISYLACGLLWKNNNNSCSVVLLLFFVTWFFILLRTHFQFSLHTWYNCWVYICFWLSRSTFAPTYILKHTIWWKYNCTIDLNFVIKLHHIAYLFDIYRFPSQKYTLFTHIYIYTCAYMFC